MFVEEQVVITKVAATHVPVEVFRLQIEGEHISQQRTQCPGNLRDSGTGQIRPGPGGLLQSVFR